MQYLQLFTALAGCLASIGCAQSLDHLELMHVAAEKTTYRGVAATHLVQALDQKDPHFNTLALLAGDDFQEGTIEIDLAGAVRPGAPEAGSGFLGVAFHVRPDASAYEMFYLRPNNARAAEQERRNHTTQYVSLPEWSWERTRRETPSRYESYVDLEAGAWTRLRIVVVGTTARLFVNDAAQPCLVVNDLKLGRVGGAIALWVGSGADAYFAHARVVRPLMASD